MQFPGGFFDKAATIAQIPSVTIPRECYCVVSNGSVTDAVVLLYQSQPAPYTEISMQGYAENGDRGPFRYLLPLASRTGTA